MYIMLCGYPPFNGKSVAGIYKSVAKGKFNFPEKDWESIS